MHPPTLHQSFGFSRRTVYMLLYPGSTLRTQWYKCNTPVAPAALQREAHFAVVLPAHLTYGPPLCGATVTAQRTGPGQPRTLLAGNRWFPSSRS